MTPLRRTSQLYLINRGEALPVLMAAMACGTGRIYGGGTSCSMPIIFVHRRRGVPRRPSRRRRPGPLPRLINSYYLKYHIRVCMRRIRTYATVCVWSGPGPGLFHLAGCDFKLGVHRGVCGSPEYCQYAPSRPRRLVVLVVMEIGKTWGSESVITSVIRPDAGPRDRAPDWPAPTSRRRRSCRRPICRAVFI